MPGVYSALKLKFNTRDPPQDTLTEAGSSVRCLYSQTTAVLACVQEGGRLVNINCVCDPVCADISSLLCNIKWFVVLFASPLFYGGMLQ